MQQQEFRINRVEANDEYETSFVKRTAKPRTLCVDSRSGELAVPIDFFYKVWDDHHDDKSWMAWVAKNKKNEIMGVLVMQSFVHDSEFFRWGSPLHRSVSPDKDTGEIQNVGEVGLVCARGCGSLLMRAALDWAEKHSKYDWIVVSATDNAIGWYKKMGFRDVEAFRLPGFKNAHKDAHKYRHRIPDSALNLETDKPSKMMYVKLNREEQIVLEPPRVRAPPKLSSSSSSSSLTSTPTSLSPVTPTVIPFVFGGSLPEPTGRVIAYAKRGGKTNICSSRQLHSQTSSKNKPKPQESKQTEEAEQAIVRTSGKRKNNVNPKNLKRENKTNSQTPVSQSSSERPQKKKRRSELEMTLGDLPDETLNTKPNSTEALSLNKPKRRRTELELTLDLPKQTQTKTHTRAAGSSPIKRSKSSAQESVRTTRTHRK